MSPLIEFLISVPLWAHKLLHDRGYLSWKLRKNQVEAIFKDGLIYVEDGGYAALLRRGKGKSEEYYVLLRRL